jgi:hypothetical protein
VILTPCTTGTEALYQRLAEDGTPLAAGLLGVKVEAWDDQGAPYVAGKNKLVLAATFADNRLVFVRLSGAQTWTGEPGTEPRRFPLPDHPDTPGRAGR